MLEALSRTSRLGSTIGAVLGSVLLLLAAPSIAQLPTTTSAPATTQPGEPRPRVAVVGFEPDAAGDQRDAWLATAFEELLTWRLRRVPALIAIPTIRLHQGRLELQEPDAPPPPWPKVAGGLGATHILSGRCIGSATAVGLELTLVRISDPTTTPDRVAIPAGRLFDVVDEATRWVLARFDATELPESVAKRVFAPPSRSLSAVEYFAQATAAAREERLREALRWATRSVESDDRFRPGLGLLAQLELQTGPAGRESAAGRLRVLSDLARREGDAPDRANAELALSLLSQTEGASEAAHTRAQTALTLAVENGDVYSQVAALGWLADLYVTWQPAAGANLTEDTRQRLEHDNLERAVQRQRALLGLLDRLGDSIAALPAASKLALAYERLGDANGALEVHQRTLRTAQALGSRRHEATALIYLGQWYRNHERWQEAIDALNRCLELADAKSKPAVRIALGGVYQAMRSPEQALAQFDQAHQQLRNTDDLPNQVTCLREMARLRMLLGRRQEAITAIQEAIDIAHAMEAPEEESLRAELADWTADQP